MDVAVALAAAVAAAVPKLGSTVTGSGKVL